MAESWEDENPKTKVIKDSWDDEEPSSGVKDAWDEEEEDVKDSWDQEEKPKPAPKKAPAKEPKKEAPKKDLKDMTEEEKLEAQISADLNNATELFGLSKSLDEISLKTKEECDDYVSRFYAKINVHNKAPLYVDFLEDLFKTLIKPLPHKSSKRLVESLRVVSDAKLAEERAAKAKASGATKSKARGKIKVETDTVKGDFDAFLRDSHGGGAADDFDDDDFM